MSMPLHYSFIHYLQAKRKIDDRALNGHVRSQLAQVVMGLPKPMQILEMGAGIGTMVDRLIEWGLVVDGDYMAVDGDEQAVAWGLNKVPAWAVSAPQLKVQWQQADGYAFVEQHRGKQQWDLLLAHAFLDLVDLQRFVPAFLSLLRPGGYAYFTLNFDGATVFEPTIDPELDALVEQLYHLDMDKRVIHGQPSGDSHTGRHLFGVLANAGMEILAAGSSDWAVFPPFSTDDRYFLHHILHTIDQALSGHPLLDSGQFTNWIAQRHAQVQAGQLIYMTHQWDFLGQKR